MRTSLKRLIWVTSLALLTAGCSSTESRCEDVCKHSDDCGLDPAPDCASTCESKYDDVSDACQDAFDEYADCLSDHDLACDKSCDGSFAKFFTDCAGQLG